MYLYTDDTRFQYLELGCHQMLPQRVDLRLLCSVFVLLMQHEWFESRYYRTTRPVVLDSLHTSGTS